MITLVAGEHKKREGRLCLRARVPRVVGRPHGVEARLQRERLVGRVLREHRQGAVDSLWRE
jgi:hypothetical protein